MKVDALCVRWRRTQERAPGSQWKCKGRRFKAIKLRLRTLSVLAGVVIIASAANRDRPSEIAKCSAAAMAPKVGGPCRHISGASKMSRSGSEHVEPR
jgi:hypothetical protein